MARTASANTQKYKDVEFTGKEFKYTVRIWNTLTKKGDKIDVTPMTVTLNGVLSVKGCKLIQSDNATWISFPQYKDKDGQYVSYIYTDKEFSQAEIDELAKAIEEAIK